MGRHVRPTSRTADSPLWSAAIHRRFSGHDAAHERRPEHWNQSGDESPHSKGDGKPPSRLFCHTSCPKALGSQRLAVRIAFLPLAFLAMAALAQPASAHRLNVFAHALGEKILGNAYFRGGTPARSVKITALDPSGRELGRTTTDDQGNFMLQARQRCDYRLVAETDDGHGGEYTLSAGELPAGLPPGESAPAQTPAASSRAKQVKPDTETTAASNPAVELAEIKQQVIALRRQLDEFENRLTLRDVLGAIGYIFGLAGVAYYILGIRRKRVDAGKAPHD
jgi:nickel transport protein